MLSITYYWSNIYALVFDQQYVIDVTRVYIYMEAMNYALLPNKVIVENFIPNYILLL